MRMIGGFVPALGAVGPAAGALVDGRGPLAVGVVALEDPVLHHVPTARGHAVVVEAAGVQAAGHRRVGHQVDHVGPVAVAAQLFGGGEGGPGQVHLVAEDPVELVGVAHRLVDLQHQLVAHQDQVALAGGAGLGRAQGHRLVAHARPLGRQVQVAHELPPGALVVASEGGRPAAPLDVAVGRGGGREARAGADQLLVHGGPLAGGHPLLLASEGQAGLADHGLLGPLQRGVAGLQQLELVGHRNLEGVLLHRRAPAGLPHRRGQGRQLHRPLAGRRQGLGAGGGATRQVRQALGPQGRARRRGEAPGPVHQDPQAQPRVLGASARSSLPFFNTSSWHTRWLARASA